MQHPEISMRRTIAGIALTFLVAMVAARGQQETAHSYTPRAEFAPDSATAVRTALAVLAPLYGQRQLEAEHPYVAHLSGEVWTVTGSAPAGARGGVVFIQLFEARRASHACQPRTLMPNAMLPNVALKLKIAVIDCAGSAGAFI
jgi:hypothetical protein